MLNQSPPTYNAPTMNDQSNQILGDPQSQLSNYYANFYKSSYATPSSFALPSSVDAPQPWYQQPSQAQPNVQQMISALRG